MSAALQQPGATRRLPSDPSRKWAPQAQLRPRRRLQVGELGAWVFTGKGGGRGIPMRRSESAVGAAGPESVSTHVVALSGSVRKSCYSAEFVALGLTQPG